MQHFDAYTDHKNLKCLFGKHGNSVNKRLLRWKLMLSEYYFTVHHIRGELNVIADLLSRHGAVDKISLERFHGLSLDAVCEAIPASSQTPNICCTHGHLLVMTHCDEGHVLALDDDEDVDPYCTDERDFEIFMQSLNNQVSQKQFAILFDAIKQRETQREDVVLKKVIAMIEETDTTKQRQLWNNLSKKWDRAMRVQRYKIDDTGVLVCGEHNAWVVPLSKQTAAMTYFHEHSFAQHQGYHRTMAKMRKHVWWPRMHTTVHKFIRTCHACQLAKGSAHPKHGLMKLFPAYKPFDTVHMDIVGPLPVTTGGYKYCLTIIDRFTRFCDIIPLGNITAETIAHAFIQN